ncbi:MAG: choline-sulfatase [Defluviicoccus sp.]|nr:choline-sulfatase [Defluviicoccus sp.]MDE0383255.1 choline-sulfatase [Defluviicoccus sp.]
MARSTARRPNLLLIMADQLAPQVLRAYGGSRAMTPNIDRLAEQGVVFENAYCNFPLCAPSRVSMLSGRLPSRIGAFDNAAEFPVSVPTFNHYLREAGYRTCLAGKMHFVGPDQLHGYEERVTTDIYPSDFLWSPDWRLEDESWLEWYHSMRAVLDAGPHRRSVNVAYDDEVAFEAIRWLHERADDDRPFALTVSFISPHDPYLAPPPWWERYRGVEMDRPAVADIQLENRDPHSRRHWFLTGRHRDAVGEPDVLRMRRAYCAVTGYVDAKVGELLRTLDGIGAADDTMIVFASDHGDLLGERGMFFKMSFFEWSVRVPLIVHAPFAFAPGRVAANVSLLDLFPTLLEAAGDGALPELAAPVDGRSLAPLASTSGAPDWPDLVCAEYTAEGARAPQLMVRQGPYKLIAGRGDPPMLFDLGADPDERHDLARDPASAGRRAELEAVVAETWDVDALDRAVRQSQAARRLVGRALGAGARTPWDYRPLRDPSRLYFRELGDVRESYAGSVRR